MRIPLAKKLVALLYPTGDTQLLEQARIDFSDRWGTIERESEHIMYTKL